MADQITKIVVITNGILGLNAEEILLNSELSLDRNNHSESEESIESISTESLTDINNEDINNEDLDNELQEDIKELLNISDIKKICNMNISNLMQGVASSGVVQDMFKKIFPDRSPGECATLVDVASTQALEIVNNMLGVNNDTNVLDASIIAVEKFLGSENIDKNNIPDSIEDYNLLL